VGVVTDRWVYAGVDIGVRKTTICRLNATGIPTWHTLEASPQVDAWEACRVMGVLAARWPWDCSVAWLERPMGRSIRSVADLSRVVGAVMAGIPARVLISEIPPTSWRVAVGLKGNCPKSAVMGWADEWLGYEPVDQDAADAYAIATACRLSSERAVALLEGDGDAGA
jgi:hypothetical protein